MALGLGGATADAALGAARAAGAASSAWLKRIGMITCAPLTAAPSTVCGFIWNKDAILSAAAPNPRPEGASATTWQSATLPAAVTLQAIRTVPSSESSWPRGG